MAKQFKLSITLGNDAMQTGADVADALMRTAAKFTEQVDFGPTERGTIFDLNGNLVGLFEVSEPEAVSA